MLYEILYYVSTLVMQLKMSQPFGKLRPDIKLNKSYCDEHQKERL